MTDEIKTLYDQALRFDEGDLRFAVAYLEAEHAVAKIEETVETRYGHDALILLQEYADALYEIAELEGQHYFQQGYLAGQGAKKQTG